MYNKGFTPIIILIAILLIAGLGGYVYFQSKDEPTVNTTTTIIDSIITTTTAAQPNTTTTTLTSSTQNETAKTTLTLESLKNAEYYSIIIYPDLGKFRLNNGVYAKSYEELYPDKPEYKDSVGGISVRIYEDKIAFGDLNNDGIEDAVVVLITNSGGTGCFRELIVMGNQEGIPKYIAGIDLGDRVIINSLSISSGIITVNMISHGRFDSMCCPKQKKIYQFKLFNNQLELIEKDETADWQTYITGTDYAGIIEQAYEKDGEEYVDVNFIKFVRYDGLVYGKNGEQGDCDPNIEPPSLYCIVDNDKTIRSYVVASDAIVLPATYPEAVSYLCKDLNMSDEAKDYTHIYDFCKEGSIRTIDGLQSPFCVLKIENNVIKGISEIYVP